MAAEVKIAQFKSRLSEYLRSVRRGHEIIIKDRETPIARVVPYKPERKRLVSIPPTISLAEAERLILSSRKEPTVSLEDLEQALREERRDRFENGPL